MARVRKNVFVPYWGSLFQNEAIKWALLTMQVFVPYWGSLFQNYRNEYMATIAVLRFRPLLGFFISKYVVQFVQVATMPVFVPYWGSLFQN